MGGFEYAAVSTHRRDADAPRPDISSGTGDPGALLKLELQRVWGLERDSTSRYN